MQYVHMCTHMFACVGVWVVCVEAHTPFVHSCGTSGLFPIFIEVGVLKQLDSPLPGNLGRQHMREACRPLPSEGWDYR